MTVNGQAYPAVLLDAEGKVLPLAEGIQFTDAADQPGSGGGSVPVGTLVGLAQGDAANNASSDDGYTLPMDGSTVLVSVITAAPPDWLDTSGNIIATGLYQFNCLMQTSTPATTPGFYVQWNGPNGIVSELLPVDPLSAGAIPSTVCALAAADLPYPTGSNVVLPSDVTGVLSVTPAVRRLASATT